MLILKIYHKVSVCQERGERHKDLQTYRRSVSRCEFNSPYQEPATLGQQSLVSYFPALR